MATKFERQAEKKIREDMNRRIKLSTQRWFSDSWTALPADTRNRILTEWEKRPGERATSIERDLLERARKDYDQVLAQFRGAAARFETPVADKDFYLNASQTVLDRLIADEMAKAGRAYAAQPVRSAGGTPTGTAAYESPFRPFQPGERAETEQKLAKFQKQLALARENAVVSQLERDFEAKAKEYERKRQFYFTKKKTMRAGFTDDKIEWIIGDAPDAGAVVVARERLHARAKALGESIPAPQEVARLATKVAMTENQLKRGGYGGYKSKGNASSRSTLEATAEASAREQNRINEEVREFVARNPDASAAEIRQVARRARIEYRGSAAAGGERTGGRVAAYAKYAAKADREVLEKAKSLARMQVGDETWSQMSEEDREDAAQPFIPSFEKIHRNERALATRIVTRDGERVVEDVWGTPADRATLSKMFGAYPTLWIYQDFGGRVKGEGGKRGARVPNPTFANANGKPRLLTDTEEGKELYAKMVEDAVKRGQDPEAVPKTYIAMARARWNKDRAYLTETPSIVTYDASGNPMLQRDVGVPRVLKDGKWVEASEAEIKAMRRTLYDKNAKEKFYRKGTAIDPTLRIINEAKRRIRDELDAFGMPKRTKEEKRAYEAKVESLVPLMAGSILAGRGVPRDAAEVEMAAFLTNALKTGEIVVPKDATIEVERAGKRTGTVLPRVIREEPLRLKAIEIVDERYRQRAAQIAPRTGQSFDTVLKHLRANEEADVEKEFLSLIRGERGSREGLRIRKKKDEKLDGLGLLGMGDDLGGTITVVAIGGLIAYALFKAITTRK